MTSITDGELRRRRERLERLRKLGLQRGASQLPAPKQPEPAEPRAGDVLELPGAEVDTPYGPTWVRETRYPLAGHPGPAAWLTSGPAALAALARDPSLLGLDPARALFLDTETTGLSLGAGTYTFLIGAGTFDLTGDLEPAFVVRQYFMRNPAEERAQLHLVEEALADSSGIVSFNGRSFDMPLVANRFILNEMPFHHGGAPHLDLLPPSRRVWRIRWGSCSLDSLERNVLAVQRTAEDVPGYLIPDIYRSYWRTGTVTELLVRVFYHNLEDIVSMPLLGARLAGHFEAGRIDRTLQEAHPLEALGLGRSYSGLDWGEEGIAAYRAALAGLTGAAEQTLVLRELADLYKRLGRREEAATVWEEWIGTVPGDDLTPYVELAKYHEWVTGDLEAARGWAAWAHTIAERWAPGPAREAAVPDLSRRLARLTRKLAARAIDTVTPAP